MSKTIAISWIVDGSAADATSCVLSNPTGSYGIKRNDLGTVVVANNTAMARTGLGQYSYTFEEPAANVSYSGFIKLTYNGAVYYFDVDFVGHVSFTTATLERYSPARVLAAYLGVLEPVGEESVWPIYTRQMPDTSDRCICTYDTTPTHQGRIQTSGQTVVKHGVQILVRAPDYETCWAKANWIAETLDLLVNYSREMGDGYLYTIRNISRRSGPIAMGVEPGTRRELCSINVMLTMYVREV